MLVDIGNVVPRKTKPFTVSNLQMEASKKLGIDVWDYVTPQAHNFFMTNWMDEVCRRVIVVMEFIGQGNKSNETKKESVNVGALIQLNFGGKVREVTPKEYQGHRVLTFKDVDDFHERVSGTARKRFNENKQRFAENEDYFFVKANDLQTSEKRTFEIPNRGLILLTESGYLMLVKSFTDDLSWEVQRSLVNSYFRLQEIERDVNTPVQRNRYVQHLDEDQSLAIFRKARSETMILNAKTRQAKLLSDMADKYQGVLSNESVQLLIASATEVLTGKSLLPKPEIESKHYTAGELSVEFSVSAHRIGRISNQNGLKTEEFGKWVLDKSPHSTKQVQSFLYNDKGKNRIAELLQSTTEPASKE